MKAKTVSIIDIQTSGISSWCLRDEINIDRIKGALESLLFDLYHDGYTRFISGMSSDIDYICAESILSLKDDYDDVIFECALPCYKGSKLSKTKKMREDRILEQANYVYSFANNWIIDCFRKRDRYIIENSDYIIFIVSGNNRKERWEVVKYSKELRKKILYIMITEINSRTIKVEVD